MDRRTLRLILWTPLLLFLCFALLVLSGLVRPGERAVGSQMVGQPAPALALPAALPGVPAAGPRGARLVNLFASWCVPCAVEAPTLATLARRGVPIDGVAVRDRPADLRDFLRRYGNPYRAIAGDPQSRASLALGASGVPETFVIDARGVIRAQHIGPLMPDDVPAILAALAGGE